ncbi:hypothetical protein FACS1894132_04790 [Clostridia bacterium]|nr:hypothetical protein FACS1894132_04790 [Clostridia bacterium]
MLNLSNNFTLEDIRKIRDDFAMRHQNSTFDEMNEEIHKNASIVLKEIEEIRKQKQQHSA